MTNGKKPTELERLTQPGGRTLPDDESIPVLTERLTLPSLELDISLPPAAARPPAPAPTPSTAPAATAPAVPAPAPAPKPVAAPAPPPAPPATAASAAAAPATRPLEPPPPPPAPVDDEIDWETVEERAREALLRELQTRLSAEIDRQLRERLQPTLVRLLLATVSELRPSIEAAVRDAASRAVAAEIARQRGH